MFANERIKEFDILMKRWVYIGTGGLFLLIITIILYYYWRNWVQLVLILAQLILIYISIKGYIDLKKEKNNART